MSSPAENRLLSECAQRLSRRALLHGAATGLGVAALAALLADDGMRAAELAALDPPSGRPSPDTLRPYAARADVMPTAKRAIYLFQSGGPSQMDLFDYKPALDQLRGAELPDSIRRGQRLTGMTSSQSSFPVAPSRYRFARRGDCGAWVSELLPNTARIVDELCFIKSMHTEAINHDPAVTFFQTGAQLAGRPSIGAWLAYGLGSENRDLPAFVVMISQGSGNLNDQPLYDRLWGSGFLPSEYQGVKLRSVGDPVLYLSNPRGFSANHRRQMLDDLARMNHMRLDEVGDPEIATRIAQYEMAFRMQTSAPELVDLSDEPEYTFTMYGDDARRPGTYAYNCLLARRMVERDVRFVQLFHRGWDQHLTLPKQITGQCRDTDRASAALVVDLKQRGLLDDTLVVWGGEFGRTVYCQGPMTADNYGRDHHPRCFTIWMAGGGVRPGTTLGETDDYSYNIVADPIHVHDLHATILHMLGIDHLRLTYKFQGRHYRLTDVHGNVVHQALARGASAAAESA